MKSYGVTIQMKPLQQYFHMVLFIFTKSYGVTIQTKHVFSSTFTWCYLLNAVLTFQPVGEILWCNHSNKTSPAVLSYGAIHFESPF